MSPRLLGKQALLGALAAFLFFAAWNRGLGLLYGMFALVLATIGVAHVFPRLALRNLSGRRMHVATGFEDAELVLEYELSNSGIRTRRLIEVIDRIPSAPPAQQQPLAFIAAVPRRGLRRFDFRLRCDKRGEYQLGPLTLRSGFPLGLAQRTHELPGTRSALLVYPSTFRIAALPFLGGGVNMLRGTESLSSAGGNEDFFGTREYRRGDSPRHIHWRSSARHGQLIVKEFELRGATEVTLVLDLHRYADVGSGKQNTLEYAVKIAASIAQYALARGHEVQLIGYGASTTLVPAGRGTLQLARLLEALARVRADGELRFAGALKRAAGVMRDGGVAVLLTVEPAQDPIGTIQALSLLRGMRVRPIGVFLDAPSFGRRPDARSSGAGPSLHDRMRVDGMKVYRVSCGDAFEGIFA